LPQVGNDHRVFARQVFGGWLRQENASRCILDALKIERAALVTHDIGNQAIRSRFSIDPFRHRYGVVDLSGFCIAATC
jgi:hypothetical protein